MKLSGKQSVNTVVQTIVDTGLSSIVVKIVENWNQSTVSVYIGRLKWQRRSRLESKAAIGNESKCANSDCDHRRYRVNPYASWKVTKPRKNTSFVGIALASPATENLAVTVGTVCFATLKLDTTRIRDVCP